MAMASGAAILPALLAKDPRFNALSGGAMPQSFLSGGMMSGQLMKKILDSRNRQVGAIAGVSDLDPISARLASAAQRKGQVFTGAAEMFSPIAKSEYMKRLNTELKGVSPASGGGSSNPFGMGFGVMEKLGGGAVKGVKKLLKKIF